jgi:gentisate 1,2-dioxygenase
VVAKLPEMPLLTFGPFQPEPPSRVETFDLSPILHAPAPATSPSLLANFAIVVPQTPLSTKAQAASEIFFVVCGKGITETPWGTIAWEKGDAFVLPGGATSRHLAAMGSVLYWVHDAPLLAWLGVRPSEGRFKPLFLDRLSMRAALDQVLQDSHALKRNRNGIIPVHPEFRLSKTVSPVLWSLVNEVPPHHLQKPHRHTTVALDLVVEADKATTLLGHHLDAQGHITDVQSVQWQPGMAFTTPS